MIIDHKNNRKSLGIKRSLEDSLLVDKPRYYNDNYYLSKRKKQKREMTSAWNVSELPTIPDLYIKLKTTCAIFDDSPKTVADRIVECAKVMSAVGLYDDEKAAATLRIDDMELCIQLFKAINCVVVEIRRKNGSSISFHKAARALINSAKGKTIVISASVGPPSPTRPLKRKRKEDETATNTVERVDSLLRKDRVDANLLGMESLVHLTTSGSSSDEMALFTANVVMTCTNYVIKDKVFSLIKNSDVPKDVDTNVDDVSFYGKMRNRALALLSNSLEVISNSSKSSLESKVSTEEWIKNGGIVSTLVEELKNAETSPQEAYLAAKCLKIIVETSNDLKSHVIDLEALDIVRHSQKVGHCIHNLLGSISDDLLDSLAKPC